MTRTAYLAALLAGTMALTGTIAAAKGAHGPQPSFSELDADGSGEVTMEEMAAFHQTRLAAIDTDGDGAISRDEMVAAAEARNVERMERRMDRMFERADANEDGLLQFDEMPQRGGDRMADRFERIDTDGSGGLSEAEMAAAKEARGSRKGGDHGGNRDG